MPQETKSDGVTGKGEAGGGGGMGGGRETLYGWSVDLRDEAAAREALDKAFDYRGDVTLRLRSGGDVTGYIFDRVTGHGLKGSYVRVLPSDGGERRRVTYAEVARVEFSGRDAAHGKSFETWVKKYVEKKLKGEKASIDSEEGV